MSEITLYPSIKEAKNGETISINEFLNSVKTGRWKTQVDRIKSITDKKTRQEEKTNNIPYVTISGKFKERNKHGLEKHSGFICMDFDDVDQVDDVRELLRKDKYVYSAFTSISGRGLAALVRIDPKKHLDAFLALEVYFANQYGLMVDRQCKDVSRPRYVSADAYLFINDTSEIFTSYLPKSEKIPQQKLPNVILGDGDIDYIIEQIRDRALDLTDSSYDKWLKIGFALAEEFGETGRNYYHQISQFSSKYDSKRCDKQFDHCLKSRGNGNEIKFPTFLYYAKNEGVSIISPQTKLIATVAAMTKKGGRTPIDAANTLNATDNIEIEESLPLIKKVFQREDLTSNNKLSILDSIKIFLNSNYNLRRNEITRFIENNGVEIDSVFTNSAYIRMRQEVDDKIKFDEVDKVISSDFTENYNPIKEFLEKRHLTYKTPETSHIKTVSDSINSDMRFSNEQRELLFKKWLVGMIASVYEKHSPLLLVLTGGQNTGKTQFFRRLLPKELQQYYAESKLDSGKDDALLMTQKMLIVDDEFGGKSKKEAKTLKELTSKQYFTLREPYGRKNVTIRRLAVLAGTSNDNMIINDPTGNRRIIPIRVESIDHNQYNGVDKLELMLEAYDAYKNGFEYELTKEDIKMLNDNTIEFEAINVEREAIMNHFCHNSDRSGVFMTSSQMLEHVIKKSGLRLIPPKFFTEVNNMNFMQEVRQRDGRRVTGYWVTPVDDSISNSNGSNSFPSPTREVPF